MKIRIDHYIHLDPDDRGDMAKLLAGQVKILSALARIEHTMTANLDRLTTEVAENTTVIESAVVLINGLADALRAAATDPAAISALADKLDAQSNSLAAAVAANTPSDPGPPPVEEPPAA